MVLARKNLAASTRIFRSGPEKNWSPDQISSRPEPDLALLHPGGPDQIYFWSRFFGDPGPEDLFWARKEGLFWARSPLASGRMQARRCEKARTALALARLPGQPLYELWRLRRRLRQAMGRGGRRRRATELGLMPCAGDIHHTRAHSYACCL